jgi:integrase
LKAYIDYANSERPHYSRLAIKPVLGNLRPDQINEDQCERYIERRRLAGISDGTIRRELTDLRSAVNRFAKDCGAKFKLPPSPPPRDVYLTKDQYRALREAAASVPHLVVFLELAIATGGRKEAVLNLTWDRVRFDLNRIDLGIGSGNKRRAVVPMTQTVRRVLTAQKARAETPYVVEYGSGKVGNIRKAFESAVKRAGLDDGVTPHVLRHSAAVWMAEAGRPMSEIAQYLGHTDEQVTFRVYARYSPEYLAHAAAALEID